eukprot:CAMPEP_0171496502 /NCGR_PEP_ID=MMETSP0958-20121227/6741_1 /TAXON_ID=87120 /ORGANISM="Aurantiochytrium limacinum, Strain ATCCMYA-1381" /LENGTH=358 /DNA_ID=CAMNT_0012030619 /DNA_START=151 /DNA_END=1227 /DNA_ORIENTATION=-
MKLSALLLLVACLACVQPSYALTTLHSAWRSKGIMVQGLDSGMVETMVNASEISFEPATTCGPMCASWTFSTKGLPLPLQGSRVSLAIKRSSTYVRKWAEVMAPYYYAPEDRQFCAIPSSDVPTLDEIPESNAGANFATTGCSSDSTCRAIAAGGGIDYVLFDNEAFANETCAKDTIDSGDCEICQETYSCSEYFGNSKYTGKDIIDSFVTPWFDNSEYSADERDASIASTMCLLDASSSKDWTKLESAAKQLIDTLVDYNATDSPYAFTEVTTYIPIDESEYKSASEQLEEAVIAVIYQTGGDEGDGSDYQLAYDLVQNYNSQVKSKKEIALFNCTGTWDASSNLKDDLPAGCTEVV